MKRSIPNFEGRQAVEIAVDPRVLKRIGITCRCGVRAEHVLPGELVMAGIRLIVGCPSPACEQEYGVLGDNIVRLDKDRDPDLSKGNPVIGKSPIPSPVSDLGQKTHQEVIDNDGKSDIPFISAEITTNKEMMN